MSEHTDINVLKESPVHCCANRIGNTFAENHMTTVVALVERTEDGWRIILSVAGTLNHASLGSCCWRWRPVWGLWRVCHDRSCWCGSVGFTSDNSILECWACNCNCSGCNCKDWAQLKMHSEWRIREIKKEASLKERSWWFSIAMIGDRHNLYTVYP